MDRLQKTVEECREDRETTISKFQQEVYEEVGKVPGVRAKYNC